MDQQSGFFNPKQIYGDHGWVGETPRLVDPLRSFSNLRCASPPDKLQCDHGEHEPYSTSTVLGDLHSVLGGWSATVFPTGVFLD